MVDEQLESSNVSECSEASDSDETTTPQGNLQRSTLFPDLRFGLGRNTFGDGHTGRVDWRGDGHIDQAEEPPKHAYSIFEDEVLVRPPWTPPPTPPVGLETVLEKQKRVHFGSMSPSYGGRRWVYLRFCVHN